MKCIGRKGKIENWNQCQRDIKFPFLFCFEHKNQWKYFFLFLVLPLSLAIGGIAYSVFSNNYSSFTLTVRVAGWENWGDTIISSLMKEEIKIGNDYMKQPMNKNGQVVFTKIPNEYKGKTLPIHITKFQNVPFYLTDSIIKVGDDESKILIGLKGLDKLHGFVMDEKGIGILNATVVVAGIERHTNNRGYFEVDSIPINKQRQEQEIEIFKGGYKTDHSIIPMMGEEPIRIILPFDK
jgi:hypothetical protein